jgi:hypothetical protein
MRKFLGRDIVKQSGAETVYHEYYESKRRKTGEIFYICKEIYDLGSYEDEEWEVDTIPNEFDEDPEEAEETNRIDNEIKMSFTKNKMVRL